MSRKQVPERPEAEPGKKNRKQGRDQKVVALIPSKRIELPVLEGGSEYGAVGPGGKMTTSSWVPLDDHLQRVASACSRLCWELAQRMVDGDIEDPWLGLRAASEDDRKTAAHRLWRKLGDAFIYWSERHKASDSRRGEYRAAVARVSAWLDALRQGAVFPEFDSARETVLCTEGDENEGNNEEEAQIARGRAAPPSKINVSEDFAGAVGALKSRLVPTVTDQDIADLEAVLREAQENPPEDRSAFVDDVNAILDATGMRLLTDDDQLARLRLLPSGVRGTIQLGVTGGTRGFKKARLRVVRPGEAAPTSTTEPT